MGGEETVTEVSEAAANGTAAPEQKENDFALKKEGGKDEVKEMEEDGKDDGKVEMQKMDMDIEGKENEQTLEGKKEEEKKQNEEENEEKKEEAESEAMEEETEAKTERGEEKVEGKADELTDVEERTEENKREKASKKRGRGKSAGAKIGSAKKDVEEKKELKTPVVSVSERPVRERKSVERLVASIEKDSVKEFHIEKGSGTALKDIPNVSYKISKRKNDDILKLLHTILFGRRGKAIQIKSNISRFSGFVWKENEEKQKIKVKEKLDKCVKEKLLEFCDVLDIPMAKATTKKEEIVIKLIDFLVAPHATTTELLAEKEQSSKGKKRKRVVKPNASLSGSTPSKRSAKSQKVIEDATEGEKNKTLETEDKSDEEEEEEEETMNGIPEKSKTDVPQHSESGEDKDEFEDESEEDTSKKKRGSKKSSAKKESVEKPKSKKVRTPKKSGPPTKRTPGKSSSNHPKVDDNSDSSPKTFSRKKRTETVKQKSLAPKKPSSKEKTGKKVATGKDKPKEDKLKPSDDELRNAIVEILKEVDFNTATFTDILKQLAGRFKLDLTPRKSSIKLMIQDELTKLADEADDEEDEGDADADADAEKDETEPSRQGVEA